MAHPVSIRPAPINRISNQAEGHDAGHLEAVRAAIEFGRKVLKDNPPPDTFAGGKSGKARGTFVREPQGDEECVAAKKTMNANRKLELQHLSTADAQIVKLERIVSEQMARVKKLRRHGYDTQLSEEILRAFEANLQVIRDHREVIIRTLDGIDHGS
jgi:hypothetical protein